MLKQAIAVSLAVASITCSTVAVGETNSETSSHHQQASKWSEILSSSTTANDLNTPLSAQPKKRSIQKNFQSLTKNSKKSPAQTTTPDPDPNYIIPPQIAPEEKLNPQTTTLPLNDIPISHLTEWEFSTSYTFAETTETPLFFNGTLKLDSEVVESLTRSNIYTVDQKGSYLQLRTIPYKRRILTTTAEPQTMSGLELQMSLTGLCFLPNAPRDRQCTYTPGLVIDRNSIDPKFFVPTRVFQTSQVGDVVTPESLAVIQLPGFQR